MIPSTCHGALIAGFGKMRLRKAISFAVIKNRITGRIVRIFNPDYEFELDLHHVAENEIMLRLAKKDFAIARGSNAMVPADAYRILRQIP